MRLVEDAQRQDAMAVTTAKDFVRLPDGARHMITAVKVQLQFDDPARLDEILAPTLRAARG